MQTNMNLLFVFEKLWRLSYIALVANVFVFWSVIICSPEPSSIWHVTTTPTIRKTDESSSSSPSRSVDNFIAVDNSEDEAITSTNIVGRDAITISKTISTLQVVSNPVLSKETSPVASSLFRALKELDVDLVRYVPWFPYPQIGAAELEPPDLHNNTTYWNFSHIKQQLYDVVEAVTTSATTAKQHGRVVINFSTQPTWMFNTSQWDYERDINKADWSYPRGRMMTSTAKLVAEYYGRLASWLINGQFEDEFGTVIKGGPAFGLDKITHWEILNEPNDEHQLSIQEYNILYDFIVAEIRNQVDPNHTITFVGMSTSGSNHWDWFEGFLNLTNHQPSVRDAVSTGYVSFHWYAHLDNRTNISEFDQPFAQIPTLLEDVDKIIMLRNQLSPTTKLALNEIGVIPKGDNDINSPLLPPIYYNMAAGLYVIVWSELSVKGVDIVGSSQFCGCPALPEYKIPNRQFPSVSMTNWTSGHGNPRYWTLKLLLEYFGPGDQIIVDRSRMLLSPILTEREDEVIYSQERITATMNRRGLILVNKSHNIQNVRIGGGERDNNYKKNINKKDDLTDCFQVHTVDGTTHDGPWKTDTIRRRIYDNNNIPAIIEMKPFAISIVLSGKMYPAIFADT